MYANVNKTNGVKLLAVVAILAMVVCAFAAIMPAEQTDAATSTGETLYISGGIDKPTDYNGNTVIVDGDLTITNNSTVIIGKDTTFTINEGVTVTIQSGSSLVIAEDAKSATVNGDLVINGKDSALVVASDFNNEDHTKGLVVSSTGSITAEKGAWIASSVLSGDPITNTDGVGSIVLKSGATLDVKKTASNVSMIRSVEVVMYEGSTFNTEGYFKNVLVRAVGDVSYYTAGSIYLDNSYDGEFRGLNNRNTSDLTFTVTTQTGTAYYKNTEVEKVTLRQYVLNVDGSVDGIVTGNNGNNDTYSPDWLVFTPTDELSKAGYGTTDFNGVIKNDKTYSNSVQYFKDEDATSDAYIPLTSVTGNLDVSENGKITFGSKSYTTVSGSVSTDYDEKGVGKVQFHGFVYVSGSMSLDASGYNSVVASSKFTVGTKTTLYIDGGSVDIINGTETLITSIYGAGYLDDSDSKTDVFKLGDLDTVITAAAAIEADVYVYGLDVADASTITTVEDATKNGAYIIDTNITVPDGMSITFYNLAVVSSDATLTFADGSDAEIPGKIIVDGKIVDEDGTIEASEANIVYEVKKLSADESVATYTTLAIALGEAQAGETINLNDPVVITEDLTIPVDVTVVSDERGITIQSATLTVNGILDMNGNEITLSKKDANSDVGKVTVNNYIADVGSTTYGAGSIPGAYFQGQLRDTDDLTTSYITSATVAAENSADTDSITIYGKLSMGDVAFTQGDEALTITIIGEVSGNVTLNGTDIEFIISTASGKTVQFTGSVSSPVTAGTSTIDFNKAGGMTVSISGLDDGSSVTTTMALAGDLTGNATISSGEIDVGTLLMVGKYNATDKTSYVLTVGTGATLNVPKDAELTIYSNGNVPADKKFAGLVVDGTLNIDEGKLNIGQKEATPGQAEINGTINFSNVNTTITGVLTINGAMNVADDDENGATVAVTKMYVGESAVVTGPMSVKSFIAVYPGADLTGAAIDENDEGVTTSNVTEYYINGELYLTSYAVDSVTIGEIIDSKIKISGYEDIILDNTEPAVGASSNNSWYSDEAMTEPVYGDDSVTDVATAYAKADLMNAAVRLSIGTNMTVFIDDVRYGSGIIPLTVGEHTITIQVNPGYTGTTTVTLAGQSVTGGTFTITPEMAEEYEYSTTATTGVVLSVMGDIAVDVPSTGSSDDGMGLTDYLLIILVVLIVIMAIMVAMRLMRS